MLLQLKDCYFLLNCTILPLPTYEYKYVWEQILISTLLIITKKIKYFCYRQWLLLIDLKAIARGVAVMAFMIKVCISNRNL